jgi:apolipoprotein N-acyltransferase
MAGIAVRGTAFHWVPGVVADNFDIAWPLALLFFLLMIASESLSWLILGRLSSLAFKARTIPIWLIPSTAIVFDHYWPRVFPWTMGHMLIGFGSMIQIVDIAGTLGLTWLMTAVSCVLAGIFLQQDKEVAETCSGNRQRVPAAVTSAIAMAVLVIAANIYGVAQNRSWRSPNPIAKPIKVAALQVDSSFVAAEQLLLKYSLNLNPPPDLVIWPESSLGYYHERLDNFRNEDEVYKFSREPHCNLPGLSIAGTSLLACGVLYSDDAGPEGPYRNTALLIDHNQDIIGKQTKRSLLPFGEYVPGQSLFPALRSLANIDTIREPGTSSIPLCTATGLQIGAMVCYDDINPAIAREIVAAGAEVLTAQVNAADYNNPIALRQHCMLAMLRSVENRRFFVRCASTGLTCIVSPLGEVLSQCPAQREGFVSGAIYPISKKTLYTRIGDWPVFGSLLLLVLSTITRWKALWTRVQNPGKTSLASASNGANF